MHEVIVVIHSTPDKKMDILVATLFSEAKEEQLEPGGAITTIPGSGEGGEQGERGKEEEGVVTPRRRYLALRDVLRFCFQHPPLLFPVVQFQRVLRSKIIGEIISTYVLLGSHTAINKICLVLPWPSPSFFVGLCS